jgi:hypothetical protein
MKRFHFDEALEAVPSLYDIKEVEPGGGVKKLNIKIDESGSILRLWAGLTKTHKFGVGGIVTTPSINLVLSPHNGFEVYMEKWEEDSVRALILQMFKLYQNVQGNSGVMNPSDPWLTRECFRVLKKQVMQSKSLEKASAVTNISEMLQEHFYRIFDKWGDGVKALEKLMKRGVTEEELLMEWRHLLVKGVQES